MHRCALICLVLGWLVTACDLPGETPGVAEGDGSASDLVGDGSDEVQPSSFFGRALSSVTPAMTPTLPPGFQETVVFGGLDRPTKLAFSPDGRVFVAEKSGLVKVFASLNATTPTIFADLRAEVYDFWDRGLLGLALHPDFPQTPWVYVVYTHDAEVGGTAPLWADSCPTPPGPTGDGCVASARLARLVANGDVAERQDVLLENWCQQFPSHSIGTVTFGTDGALYVGGGDGASFSFVDYGQRGNVCGDPPMDAGGLVNLPGTRGGAFRSQNLDLAGYGRVTYDGKILRLDPATGLAAPGNPLLGSPLAGQDRVVATGLRNPFRFIVRPGTHELWIGDVGYGAWEEIDRVVDPTASITNFGWPCYEGMEPEGSYRGLGADLCQALYANPSQVTPPHFTYAHTDTVTPGDACGVGQASVTGLAFYGGGSFPFAYRDALFFADFSRNCIFLMYPGPDGVPDPATRTPFAVGAAGPIDLVAGPDGGLYYVDYNESTVRRIDYVSGGHPPVARIAATPTAGSAPLLVSLDGSASSDPDPGDDLAYAWDLDDDGAFDDATGVRAETTFTTKGAHVVRLRVTDPAGISATTSVTIDVDTSAPFPRIDTPLAGRTWSVGDTIAFSGSAVDEQDGTLPPGALTWTLVLRHCPSECHSHILQQFPGVASGSFVAPDHEAPSHLDLMLTALDSSGRTGSTTLSLLPNTVTLSLASNPTGLVVSANDRSAATPFQATQIVGSHVTLSALSPQDRAGTTWVFRAWSDGGARVHDLTVPAASLSRTATFDPIVQGGALPSPWQATDVGTTGATGSTGHANDTFLVRGAGADIWGQADAFHFAYQPLAGDGQIVVRVAAIEPTDPWAKAGVMVRESLTAGSRHAMMVLTPANGAAFQRRESPGGWSQHTGLPGMTTPRWVRLVRAGSTLTGYVSSDGATWTQVGSSTFALPANVLVGLVVTAGAAGTLCDTVFDGVTVGTGGGVPTNLAPTATVTSPAQNASFVAPATIGIAASAGDSDGTVARVDFYGDSALLGSDPSAPYTFTWTSVATGSHTVQARAVDNLGAVGASAPVTISVTSPGDGGLPAPWAQADVGAVGVPGTAIGANGAFQAQGAGADIWSQADAFHFVYQPFVGDGQIVARVASIEPTDPWAKAGVMVRESLAAGSRHAMMALTPGNGAAFQRREGTGGWSQHAGLPGVTAPRWVRLVRAGTTLTGYVSTDGAAWTQVGGATFTLPADVLIGLAVTAGNASTLCDVSFDGVAVQAVGTGPGNVSPTASLTSPASNASFVAPATIALAATANDADGTIARVDFYGDGGLLGSDPSAPYTLSWTGVAAGSHTVQARAVDNLGAVGASAPVAVSVTSPGGGGLPAPWTQADVGAVGVAGTATGTGSQFLVQGAGADIWSQADAFHYVYQPWTGNGQFVARVAAVEPTDPWAKAGLMVRESLAAGSRHAMIVLTPANGAAFQHREGTGGWTQHASLAGVAAPRWVRLVRTGSTITGHVSADGVTWTQVGSATFALPANVLVGLAVTAGTAGTLCDASFDGITVAP